jgi:hypothetical protein
VEYALAQKLSKAGYPAGFAELLILHLNLPEYILEKGNRGKF